jgi:hypothetical protein
MGGRPPCLAGQDFPQRPVHLQGPGQFGRGSFLSQRILLRCACRELTNYDFAWPSGLHCAAFAEEHDGGICDVAKRARRRSAALPPKSIPANGAGPPVCGFRQAPSSPGENGALSDKRDAATPSPQTQL